MTFDNTTVAKWSFQDVLNMQTHTETKCEAVN